MSEPAGKSNNKAIIGCVIAAVVVGLLGLVGLGVGGYFFYLKMGEEVKAKAEARAASGRGDGSAAPVMVPASGGASTEWQRREILNVSLEAPFDFGKGEDVMASLPENVRELVISVEMMQNSARTDDILFQVMKSTYKPGIPVSLDGAIQGAMRSAAGSMGDADPKFTNESVKVSNLEARRASYDGKLQGRATHVVILAVQREHTFWQIQALVANPADIPAVQRMLDSLEIVP